MTKPITKKDYAGMLETLRKLEGRRVRVIYRAEDQTAPRPREGVLTDVRAHARLGHPLFRVDGPLLACLDDRLVGIEAIEDRRELCLEVRTTEEGARRLRELHASGELQSIIDSVAPGAVVRELRGEPVAVCPRCLDIEPGKPGGSPDSPHPGPFRDEVCEPCARDNIRNLEREGRAADAERARQQAADELKKIARAITVSPSRLTRAQSAQAKSLVEDSGYSRKEARALVLAGGFVP